MLERIAAALCPTREDLVIEIGPGRGALTEKLLSRARRVIAIELDPSLASHLRLKFSGSEALEIVEADALETDLGQWGSAPLAGNLPYYAATPIIAQAVRLPIPRAIFLIQKEVADRLAAAPGTRAYGLLTVATAVFARVRLLFEVKPSAFHPPPKVDSAVVLVEPHAPPPALAHPDEFLNFAALCFRQKRKTIRNNLAGVYGRDAVARWPEAGLRAEQIPVEGLMAMYARVAGLPPFPS